MAATHVLEESLARMLGTLCGVLPHHSTTQK